MTNRSTSRSRFGEFLQKYRKGELKSSSDDQESDDSNENGVHKKHKRRSYLRLYGKRLWPHWKLVTTLGFLAILVSVLEIIQPLFARYIFDDVLL
ncbi:MAG: hypothetical protein AAGA30_07525, partial [Planctomycetota bacterium]